MATKQAPKYAQPKRIVKSGFRRVTKSELKALGYSPKSALYTKAGIEHPTKFLTRSQIKENIEYVSPERNPYYAERAQILKPRSEFAEIKKERILAARRKLFRHTHTVYSDYEKPVTLQQAITLTEKFFDFLENRYHPTWRNQIGLIYKGVNDDFSIQPRLWRDRYGLIIDQLKNMLKKYKAKMQIIFIIGWIEQSS